MGANSNQERTGREWKRRRRDPTEGDWKGSKVHIGGWNENWVGQKDGKAKIEHHDIRPNKGERTAGWIHLKWRWNHTAASG